MIKSTNAAKPASHLSTPTNTKAGEVAATTAVSDSGVTAVRTAGRFDNAAETLQYLKRSYIPGIKAHAQDVEARLGREVKDQDYPVETVRMVPPHPKLPPLLIVGGMGPLAGAQAMEAALERFGDSREIVLLQLCTVPDRTEALDEDERLGGPSDTHKRVVAAIKDGFASGEDTIECKWAGQSHTVVACNTAHNFAPQAFEVYQQERAHNANLQMHSLVKCVVAELAQTERGQEAPVMILGTHGTLRTRLYLNPLEANGVRCAVPEPHGQKLLGYAIYKGVKASKEEKTIEYGNALFLELKAKGQIVEGKPFVILAGCTEVPEIVNVLKEKGDPEVKALLANAQVADPMAITLAHIAQLDAPVQVAKL
jgi:aspartate/glutamate racemase